MKSKFSRSYIVIILAVLCTLLWGSAFSVVKIGYNIYNIQNGDIYAYILFAGFRFFIAGILTFIICYLFRLDDISTIKTTYMNIDFLKKSCILGFLLTFFQYLCFYIGLSYSTGTNSSIIAASSTIFTVLLSYIFFKNENFHISSIIGIILGFSGILLVTLKDIGLDSISFNIKGEPLLLIAAFSFSLGTLYSKRYASKFNPITLTASQLTIGGLLLLFVGSIGGAKLNPPPLSGIFLLLYLSLVSSVTFMLWTLLLKYNPASKIAIFSFLTPVFGVILSGILLKEHIWDIRILISLLLAISSILILNKRK